VLGSLAFPLAQGEHTTQYITCFLHQIPLLIDHNLHPLVVFDAGDLPAKQETLDLRRESRLERIRVAEQLEARDEIDFSRFLSSRIDLRSSKFNGDFRGIHRPPCPALD
jgi:5'-3' exonuclease